MTFFDLFIIYLACGAPFGVYYYLHNRKCPFSRQVWLKTTLAFLFWIPFAYKLVKSGKIRRKLFNFRFEARDTSASAQEKALYALRQRIEKVFLEARTPLSIYEIREVFERYAGLTLASRNPSREISDRATELFRIAQRENVNLGAVCLQRRNQKRLEFHQSRAREDFLKLVQQTAKQIADAETLYELTLQYAKNLRDAAAISRIEKMSAFRLQTEKGAAVNEPEKEIWKPELHKPQPAKQISLNLPSLTARANSLSRD